MTVPAFRDPDGISIVTVLPFSPAEVEVNPPPASTTEPVASGLPLPPVALTVTRRFCVVETLHNEGDTMTIGVALLVPPPLPLNGTLCGESGALSEIVSVAIRVPEAVGTNATPALLDDPASRDVGQPVTTKSLTLAPVMTQEILFRADVPTLVIPMN